MTVNNGSASLIRLGDEHFAVTCHHVLDGFRQKRAESERAFFQVANCRLDPFAQLAVERNRPDVTVIRLSAAQAAEITHDSNGIGEAFLEIEDARPELVPEGAGIAFGGFPGDLRLQPRAAEFNFGSYSCGATPVTTSRDDYLVCQFERAEWVRQGYEPEPATIGGISGCPVPRIHESEAGIISHNFAGIVYEYSADFDLLYIVPAAPIYDLIPDVASNRSCRRTTRSRSGRIRIWRRAPCTTQSTGPTCVERLRAWRPLSHGPICREIPQTRNSVARVIASPARRGKLTFSPVGLYEYGTWQKLRGGRDTVKHGCRRR